METANQDLKAIYIPKKGDSVDIRLSNYLNKKPETEQMKIMFLRESDGVYQFGSKRVHIKIDKGEQLACRVGGGYIPIEQFAQQFESIESNKI